MAQPAEDREAIKAACKRVLTRNRGRNYRATQARETAQLLPQKSSPKVAQELRQEKGPITTGLPRPTPQQWEATGCGTCLYLRWVDLHPWCSHPAHQRHITGPGCGGQDYMGLTSKPLPGRPPHWPPPAPKP